jgi:formate dehydrogenase (NADP+) beta subunit
VRQQGAYPVNALKFPKAAPCEQACPAGIDVPRYVRHIRDGRFGEALAVIRERIPFPLVCGYACFHSCEGKCSRTQYDTAVAIRMLKRVAAELGADGFTPPVAQEATGKRVAVIGSGPCGLTSAYYLALLGHRVTVFEALEHAGGMMRYGIPGYRLPDAVLDADLRGITDAGVEILTQRRVDSAETLMEQGFGAVLIASGAWRGSRMGIPGEDRAEVVDGMAFLAAVSAGKAPAIAGSRVVVVGGGNTAIDAARVSRRLGAEVVQLYRRGRAEMPASPEEIVAAEEEGVRLEFLTAPVRIEQGGLTCVRMALGGADAGGRPKPQPVPGSEHRLAAEHVIMAIGQQVDIPSAGVTRGDNGAIGADPESLATAIPGVFAGGDAVTGPASVIDAIAQGRRVASAIDRYLGGGGELERFAQPKVPAALPDTAPRGALREAFAMIPLAERLGGFALVETAYDEQTAMREARRCLSCDLLHFEVRLDPAKCKDCSYCKGVCGPGVFDRSSEFNAGGYRPYLAARPETCVGCLRCVTICPDFAISIQDGSALS